MSILAQQRLLELCERLHLVDGDGQVNAAQIMAALGSLAERAFIPQPGASDNSDRRLAHADFASMSDADLWRENLRAEFVAAWGDDRSGWVLERIKLLREEQARRRNGRR